MNHNYPKIVVIGGIETGKSSTILTLWQDNITDYSLNDNTSNFHVSEFIEGREVVDFDVCELPRIKYTSNDWINQKGVRENLESADLILFVLTCEDGQISSRREYLENIFNTITLKKNVVFLIAYGFADWILFPEEARNFMIPVNTNVELSSVTNILKKVSLVESEFANFKKYDSSFSVGSIIPYSTIIDWNFEELRHQIWNGLILSINNQILDETIPTVVLAGKTGCGKTSTINALWNKELATNGVASCTKFPTVMRISDFYNGANIEFNLVDLPGIAESVEADSIYREFYYNFIDKASLLICLTQADVRAYKQDQIFYSDLIANNILRKNQNIIVGINQADLLLKSPDNPDGVNLKKMNADEKQILQDKIDDMYDNIFSLIFKDFEHVTKDSVAIYSVFQDWKLDEFKAKLYNLIF